MPGNAHKDERGTWADLPAFRRGHAWGIYMNPSPQRYNVRYRERGGGKVRSKFKECCPAGDRARGVVCEGDPVFKVKAQVYIVCQSATAGARSKGAAVVEFRWQGKREGELKERSDESKIKMEKENIRKGNEYVHKQLNVQEKLVSASEGRRARCRARRA